nr:MAG: RNA-dependent RNA polymerase [Erysiphe necator associated ourmia-like virus 42]
MVDAAASASAHCPAVGSIAKALCKAIRLVELEFDLIIPRPTNWGSNCSAARASFDEICASAGHDLSEFRRRECKIALKSCVRIFDVACSGCDRAAAQKARASWLKASTRPVPAVNRSWAYSPEWTLKERVRELVAGWGERLTRSRQLVKGDCDGWGGGYTDQNGCLEQTSYRGGTISVGRDCYGSISELRLGVVKTKGKLRVVTMQSARVKRVLSPVHDALYDHLTSFGWCVRGDVKKTDFEAIVNDRKSGESFISGDYTAATDNVLPWVTEAITSVLAEDPNLTEEERGIMLAAVGDLHLWSKSRKTRYTLTRKQMMGNLLSFPILCLINKVSYDICCDISFGSGVRRVGRFNGDDCMFNGNRKFFSLWEEVTSTFGLVVNRQKTGFSDTWLDLNSQPFHVPSGRLVPRHCLSFLRPFRNDCVDLLGEVWKGVKGMKHSVRQYAISVLARHEIVLRDFCVANIPRYVFTGLMKKTWFRRWRGSDPVPPIITGVSRSCEVVVADPPREDLFSIVDQAHTESERERVLRWEGVPLEFLATPVWDLSNSFDVEPGPLVKTLRRQGRPPLPPVISPKRSAKKFVRVVRWQYSWSKPVLDWFEREFGQSGFAKYSKWGPDHPRMVPHVECKNYVRLRFIVPVPPSLMPPGPYGL